MLVFIHPQGDGAPAQLASASRATAISSNVIGNPLETTIALSHLIFEGTLDRYPGLKICAAHAGGFLPSYAGRFDLGCPARPDLCTGGTHGPIKKTPSEYLKQMYYDTMVFTPGGRAPSGGRGRRQHADGRHRLPLSLDQDGGRPRAGDAGAERRRPDRHPGRHRGGAVGGVIPSSETCNPSSSTGERLSRRAVASGTQQKKSPKASGFIVCASHESIAGSPTLVRPRLTSVEDDESLCAAVSGALRAA